MPIADAVTSGLIVGGVLGIPTGLVFLWKIFKGIYEIQGSVDSLKKNEELRKREIETLSKSCDEGFAKINAIMAELLRKDENRVEDIADLRREIETNRREIEERLTVEVAALRAAIEACATRQESMETLKRIELFLQRNSSGHQDGELEILRDAVIEEQKRFVMSSARAV